MHTGAIVKPDTVLTLCTAVGTFIVHGVLLDVVLCNQMFSLHDLLFVCFLYCILVFMCVHSSLICQFLF